MSIEFRDVEFPPLRNLTIAAPNGAIIGIVGEKGSGKSALLRLAAGLDQPASGDVVRGATKRLIRLGEPLDFSSVELLILDTALSCQDALVKARACVELERLRREGSTILFATPDEPLLSSVADEVWWMKEGSIAAKGDPREVLPKYREHVSQRLVEWGKTLPAPLDIRDRHGDGRAEIVEIETSPVWKSGNDERITVVIRFAQPVENPVVGIMIRTRVGFEVYGTNTELEGVRVGPCAAGQTYRIHFRFRCELCPAAYTITAASHDPDGTAHDWLDDAMLVTVTDSRYTAGVANLRAKVAVES